VRSIILVPLSHFIQRLEPAALLRPPIVYRLAALLRLCLKLPAVAGACLAAYLLFWQQTTTRLQPQVGPCRSPPRLGSSSNTAHTFLHIWVTDGDVGGGAEGPILVLLGGVAHVGRTQVGCAERGMATFGCVRNRWVSVFYSRNSYYSGCMLRREVVSD
jgi:hypothetical protein